MRARESLQLLALVLLLLACNRGGCSKADYQVKPGELAADPLTAARELGNAAVKEKDPQKLAGKIAAFLDRIHVPVVRADGKDLIVKAYLSYPPTGLFLWEPVLAGIARATAKGDARVFSVVARTFLPKASREELEELDYRRMVAEAAKEVAQKKGDTADAMLITAIAADFEARGESDVNLWMDPTASLLFGLWLALSAEKAGPAPLGPDASSVPALPPGMPKLPPGVKIPGQPNAMSGAPPTACAFLEPAAKLGEKLGPSHGFGSKVSGFLSDHSAFGKLGELTRTSAAAVKLPQTVAGGLAGMGVAAFADVDGEVKPGRVKYGDGPVTYSVRVVSKSPFEKAQLDSFVGCLQTQNPESTTALEPLKSLPAAGAVANVPVKWDGTSALDPGHGKLAPGSGSTDTSGRASAVFQVKPKVAGATKVEGISISAVVSPFPGKGSVAEAGSTTLATRSVPLRLEVEAPLNKDWVFGYKETLLATGEGMSGGWSINIEASVPFSLGPNLDFSAKGQGTWSFGFSGGSGIVQCEAPTQKNPWNLDVSGKAANPDSMLAHFSLSDSATGSVKSTLRCHAMGTSVSVPMNGPASGGSVVAGTPMQSFDMPLRDGATKSFPAAHGAAKGTAKVTLSAKR